MKLHRSLPPLLSAVVAGLLPACVDGPTQPPAQNNELVQIEYRGQLRTAARRDDRLILEGDIEVAPEDIGPVDGPSSTSDLETRTGALSRLVGSSFKWPGGNVTFSLVNLNAADRPNARAAVNAWQSVVPGLHFNELTGPCPGNCINFMTAADNSSVAGKRANSVTPQDLHLGAGFSVMTAAHEIAHALGMNHEQSRSDRDTFVKINWAQVVGCRTGATSINDCDLNATGCTSVGTGTDRAKAIANGCCTGAQFDAGFCFLAHNFQIETPQALVLDYDYASVMHYSTNAFAKGASPTITALKTVPSGVTLGGATELSFTDVTSMRVLYPVATASEVFFRGTGVQPAVQLTGRTQDVDTQASCTIGSLNTTALTVDTALLAEGTGQSLSCTVKNPLWTSSYNYPNTTFTTFPASGFETFTASRSVVVLNKGLLGIFAASI
jgi:hypothetical protein